MLSICCSPVVKLWLHCVDSLSYYTTHLLIKLDLCSSTAFIQVHSTANPQPYPHDFIKFNRLFSILTHITHRYYKNNNYLYKLITINN